MRFLLLPIILFLPAWSHAAVTLSEVAWMGSSDSANYEWIELYNSGSSGVDLSGWTLTDTTNLSIELTGTIPAGGYAVLERTSDASAPGSAFLIYTGALVNTGTTLSLRRADGGLEDQIDGGDDWENIGGDNTTKETAQYTTSGWITAPGTPGAANETTVSTREPETTTTPDTTSTNSSSNKSTKKSNSSPAVTLSLPPNSLYLTVSAPSELFVRQSSTFAVEPNGVGDTIADSTKYVWNFGDGTTAKGKSVTHYYEFPGTYLVTVHGHYKRQEYVARHEITVLPVTLSITRSSEGDLQIHNDAPYEVDVSGYRIVGTNGFQFAPNSYILPRQTITLAGHRIGGTASIHDQSGRVVLREADELSAPSPRSVVSQTFAATPIAATANTAEVVVAEDIEAVEVTNVATDTTPMLIEIGGSEASADSDNQNSTSSVRWPYLGLASLILIGWLGLLYRG